MSDLKEFLATCKCAHRGGDANYSDIYTSIEKEMEAFELDDYKTLSYIKVMIENPQWFRQIEKCVNQNDYRLKYLNCNLPKLVGTLKDIVRQGINTDYKFLLEALNVRATDQYEPLEFEALLEECKKITLSDVDIEKVKTNIIVDGLWYNLARLTNNSFDMLQDLHSEFDKEKVKILPDIDKLFEILERAREQVKIAKEVQGILSNNKNDGNNYGDE